MLIYGFDTLLVGAYWVVGKDPLLEKSSLGLSSEAEVCVHVKYDDGWLDRLPQVSMCIICSILLTLWAL